MVFYSSSRVNMGFLSASGPFCVYFGLHDAVFPPVFSNKSQRPLQTNFIKAEIKLHPVKHHLLIDIVALDFISVKGITVKET